MAGGYDREGYAAQRLTCIFPDESKTVTFGNGKSVKYFPLMVVDSPVRKAAACVKVEGFAPDNAGSKVDRMGCRTQIELGMCPRGIREVDLKPDGTLREGSLNFLEQY